MVKCAKASVRLVTQEEKQKHIQPCLDQVRVQVQVRVQGESALHVAR